MRVLGDCSTGHDNNFNLLRFIAASAVLLSHCWPLSGASDSDEPLHRLIGLTMGSVSVLIFFAISGFLVASSWDRNPRPGVFIAARTLRILPALFVVLVATAFVLGPLVTTLPWSSYFLSSVTWAYVPTGLSLLRAPSGTLPGVFLTAPYPATLNGSLWTLFFEVTMYCVVLALGLVGWMRPRRFGLTLIGFALGLTAVNYFPLAKGSGTIANFSLLAPPFLAGVAAWVWRHKVPIHGLLIVLSVAATSTALHFGIAISLTLFSISIAWLTFYLAFFPNGRIRLFNNFGDYSYGIYIYAFPVQQLIASSFSTVGIAWLFIASFPVTLALSILSWHFIESPSLSFRRRLLVKIIPASLSKQ